MTPSAQTIAAWQAEQRHIDSLCWNCDRKATHGVYCDDCVPQCWCGEIAAEGSPSDACVKHTIEDLAREIQETPIDQVERIALNEQIEEWRCR